MITIPVGFRTMQYRFFLHYTILPMEQTGQWDLNPLKVWNINWMECSQLDCTSFPLCLSAYTFKLRAASYSDNWENVTKCVMCYYFNLIQLWIIGLWFDRPTDRPKWRLENRRNVEWLTNTIDRASGEMWVVRCGLREKWNSGGVKK
jgi:hypothetical protein